MVIRNPYLPKSIVDELQALEDEYFLCDEKVPFKGHLFLHPVKTKDYNKFILSSSCCTLNKNESIEGVSMTHLDYLISLMEKEGSGRVLSIQFSQLVELTLQVKNGVRCNDCSLVLSFSEYLVRLETEKEGFKCPECGGVDFEENVKYTTNAKTGNRELLIEGVVINSGDFDRFRQIVMYQNLPDFQDDSWVDADIKEDQRMKNEILRKQSSDGNATLEKKIVCVSAKSNYKIDELYALSLRKFLMLLTAIDDVITYQAGRIGLMTGMVSTKKPLEHWIYKPQKSMYGEAIEAQRYAGQIGSSSG